MFCIEVVNKELNPKIGRITINDFKELFEIHDVIDLDKDISDYWDYQLHRLVNGEKFVVLQYDPRFAWVIYRENDVCYFHNVLALDGNFMNFGERYTETDSGSPISEWEIDILSIKTYLQK